MKVWKFKNRIEIDKTIGNFHIETFHHGSFENDKPKHWTELHCWYECDCEHCPLSWEVRGYDDVDCGCYMAEYGEDYPKTDLICMLPIWIKKILLKHKAESEDKMTDCRYCINMDNCQYIIAPDDCEDFEETFEHHWEMMDDIEREKYNSYDIESEDK